MDNILTTLIIQGSKEMGITLPATAPQAFEAFFELLELRGQNVNLTALSGAEDIARLHFLDSLALLSAADFSNARVLDVGSGAGLPGVPIKIAQPSVQLTLLDSSGKRISFLSELISVLGIDAVLIQARAETCAHDPNHRGKYDIVVSRAVARLDVLCELCLPFVRLGGVFVAMKSTDSDAEIADAQHAAGLLGASLTGQYDYMVPGTGISRRAVILAKTAATPDKYPRRFARIQKSPLS